MINPDPLDASRRPGTQVPGPPNALYRLVASVGSTTGLCGALLVAMPRGFASVPYVCGVLLVFVTAFALVAWLERTAWINCTTVAFFWFLAAIVHATYLGTAPAANVRLADGLILICSLAVIHLGIQLLLHYCLHRLSRD